MNFFNSTSGPRAFSLIEAVLSIVILLMIAVLAGGLYGSATWAADARSEDRIVESLMRSQMERLSATRFAALAGGSQPVTVNGRTETLAWTCSAMDIDGDGITDSGVLNVNVTLARHSLSTIATDGASEVGKL